MQILHEIEFRSSFKENLLTCWDCVFLLPKWTGTVILSLSAKTASKKIEALICSMKFLSPEVALCLYKSPIWPSIKCCSHVCTSAPSYDLSMLGWTVSISSFLWQVHRSTILTDCMIFLSPFIYIIKMLTGSFQVHLKSGILGLQNDLLWPLI